MEQVADDFPPGVNDFIDRLPRRWYKRAGADVLAQEWWLFNGKGEPLFIPAGKIARLYRMTGHKVSDDAEKNAIALGVRKIASETGAACVVQASEGWISKRVMQEGEKMPEGYDQQHYRDRVECYFIIAQTKATMRQVYWPILPGRRLGEKMHDFTCPIGVGKNGGRFFNMLAEKTT